MLRCNVVSAFTSNTYCNVKKCNPLINVLYFLTYENKPHSFTHYTFYTQYNQQIRWKSTWCAQKKSKGNCSMSKSCELVFIWLRMWFSVWALFVKGEGQHKKVLWSSVIASALHTIDFQPCDHELLFRFLFFSFRQSSFPRLGHVLVSTIIRRFHWLIAPNI